MASTLKISEAASIALHATALMAGRPGRRLSTDEIAAELGVSKAHLAKVLQWLARAHIVVSTRGPGGGSRLARNARGVSLLQVYEAVDGKPSYTHCLFCTPRCGGEACIFGRVLRDIDAQVMKYLRSTRLSDVASVFTPGERRRSS